MYRRCAKQSISSTGATGIFEERERERGGEEEKGRGIGVGGVGGVGEGERSERRGGGEQVDC